MAITVQSVTNAMTQAAKTVAAAAMWLGRQVAVIGQGVWGALKTVASALGTAWNASKDFIVRGAVAFASSSPAVMIAAGLGSVAFTAIGLNNKNPVVRYGMIGLALVAAAYTGGAAVAGGFVPMALFPAAAALV